MSWIQGFPAIQACFPPGSAGKTADGRRVGDAHCQKKCPEPSAGPGNWASDKAGSRLFEAVGGPLRAANLRCSGPYASVALRFFMKPSPAVLQTI